MLDGYGSSSDEEDKKPVPEKAPAGPKLADKRKAVDSVRYTKSAYFSGDEEESEDERPARAAKKPRVASSTGVATGSSANSILSALPPTRREGGKKAGIRLSAPPKTGVRPAPPSSSTVGAVAAVQSRPEPAGLSSAEFRAGLIGKSGGAENENLFTAEDLDYSDFGNPGSSSGGGTSMIAGTTPDDLSGGDPAGRSSGQPVPSAQPSSSTRVPPSGGARSLHNPQSSKASFLQQLKQSGSVSKTELKELEAAAGDDDDFKSLRSDQMHDQNWLEQNPEYLAGLLEKKDTARDMNKLQIGHQVDAGSTSQVTKMAQRKHQITYLAAQAKVQENAINSQIGQGASVRKEAGQKYGW